MDDYEILLSDFDIDPSTFTVDVGEGPQLWSQYVQDSRDFGDLAGVDFSSFAPQAFAPADLGSIADMLPEGEYPVSGEFESLRNPTGYEYQAQMAALTVDPATGALYENGVPLLGGGVLQRALQVAQPLAAQIKASDATQAAQGVRPDDRTIPGWLARQVYDFKKWLEPLTNQVGGGAAGTPGAAAPRSRVADMLLTLLVGGGVIGLSQLLKGDDVKLTVPQGGTSQVTAAGNRAVMGALTEPGPGGGAAGTGTGGTGAGATGMENLQRAMQAALAGQKDLAIYYADAAQKEIEMARTALGAMPAYLNPTPETLAAAGDPVSAGLLTRLQNVFGGKISNPVLEKAITDMRDQWHNKLWRYGPGESSARIEGQRARDLNEAILRDADYRQSVAQIVPLYNAAAGHGLATRRLFAAPSQGPLSSVASIPALAGVERTDAAMAAQADREFRAALAAAQAEAASSGALSRDITNLGMLSAAGLMFGRG